MSNRPDPSKVRAFILRRLPQHASDIVHLVSEKFAISRQAAHAQVAKLVKEGLVSTQGNTRKRSYHLIAQELLRSLDLSVYKDEDLVWKEFVGPFLGELPKNIDTICYHGFTEMFNNCIDHSESSAAAIRVRKSAAHVELGISDQGIGIFEKIRSRFELDDQRQAILELSKGKLTTDPSRHSGEGIYFTSRMFDSFIICSHRLTFIHKSDSDDWLIEAQDPLKGTAVFMSISIDSERTTHQVYERHVSETEAEEFAFSSTHVPLRLAIYGEENLISRSQAKRVLRRFDRFREVLLDFSGVESIGQAFADEIFRVFYLANPEIRIIAIHENRQCRQMIRRAIGARDSPPDSPPR